MLQVSDDAGALLARYLENGTASPNAAIRFVLDRGGFALEFDSPHPGDAKFRHDGRVVLLLDRGLSDSLTNNTLHVKETPQGPSLELV